MPARAGSTIYDVAGLAGVSIATVSRYLNTPEKVNADTAGRVQSAMDSLGYVPHGNTGAASRRRASRIGVLTPFSPAPSFVERLQGMSPVFRDARCEMLIYPADSPEELREHLHSIPLWKRLDGLIIVGMRIADAEAERLAQAGLEVVMIEHHHPRFSAVEADNLRGGTLAAEHFLGRGYRRCAYIGVRDSQPYSLRPSEQRWQGYEAALAQAGCPVLPGHVRLGAISVEDGARMGLELLSLRDRPRAVFAMSDLQAIGVLRAARQLGMDVPADVAVLGFDDIEAAGYVDLSTVSQSLSESGRLAAELVLGRLREPGRPLQSVQLKVAVVPRSTT